MERQAARVRPSGRPRRKVRYCKGRRLALHPLGLSEGDGNEGAPRAFQKTGAAERWLNGAKERWLRMESSADMSMAKSITTQGVMPGLDPGIHEAAQQNAELQFVGVDTLPGQTRQ